MDDKEFAKLQKEWYAKLSKDGFEDIEWVDHKTGQGQNSDYLKRPAQMITITYDESIEEHYRIMRHFCTQSLNGTDLEHYMFEAYSEGMSYRGIVKMINENFNQAMIHILHSKKTRLIANNVSVHFVFYAVQRLIQTALRWEREQRTSNGEIINLGDYR